MKSSAAILEPEQLASLRIGELAVTPNDVLPLLAVKEPTSGNDYAGEPTYRSRHTYKRQVLPAIARSHPFVCDLSRRFEVHLLSCERDCLTSLWALKTLAVALGYVPPIVVHDDGSLTDASCAMFLEQLRGSRVIRDQEVEGDRCFEERLKPYPLTRYWRLEVDAPLARKVIDAAHYAERDYIVLLDSDILFFRHPPTLARLLEQQIPFMSPDYQSAYCPPLQELRNNGTTIDEKLNTGVCGMPRASFDLAWAERFFSIHTRRDWFPWTDAWLEQAILAGMFTCCPDRRVLPRVEHELSFYPITKQACSHHFVGDGSRELYFSSGLRQVERMGWFPRLGVEV